MIQKEKRPWGRFEVLYTEDRVKIKKILVKPGMRLSYQSHEHRSENWTVIQGRATVILEDRAHHLNPNEMIYIPEKSKHRIENRGETDLIFIEIQTGSYLGEDDITRYQDDFNRF